MLASCDRRSAIGRRDYAILTVLARLGLRAGEVAALRLEDIDWRAGDWSSTEREARGGCRCRSTSAGRWPITCSTAVRWASAVMCSCTLARPTAHSAAGGSVMSCGVPASAPA
jgi:hypothetical protein